MPCQRTSCAGSWSCRTEKRTARGATPSIGQGIGSQSRRLRHLSRLAGLGLEQAACGGRIPTDPPWAAGGKKTRNRQHRPDARIWSALEKTRKSLLAVARLRVDSQTPDSPPHMSRRDVSGRPSSSVDGACQRLPGSDCSGCWVFISTRP